MSPYIFPSTFTSDVNLGCGYMNVEARLMKCTDGIGDDVNTCLTLLKSVSLAYIVTDSCDDHEPLVDGWNVKKVDQYDFS